MRIPCIQGFKDLKSHKRAKDQVTHILVGNFSNNIHIKSFSSNGDLSTF